MITSPAFANRKFALLGLGPLRPCSCAKSLSAGGAQLLAWDNDEGARAKVADIATIADPLDADLSGYDGIVVSPGCRSTGIRLRKRQGRGHPAYGDIELFSMARPDLPPHRVIGITGTNGKSTTTALVHHLLKSAALPTRMAGNIGLPILSQAPLPAGGVYVLELSSYQIDITHSLACEAAALINLSPDHLDRYDGYEGYMASKARLFDMQTAKAAFGVRQRRRRHCAQVYAERCWRSVDLVWFIWPIPHMFRAE